MCSRETMPFFSLCNVKQSFRISHPPNPFKSHPTPPPFALYRCLSKAAVGTHDADRDTRLGLRSLSPRRPEAGSGSSCGRFNIGVSGRKLGCVEVRGGRGSCCWGKLDPQALYHGVEVAADSVEVVAHSGEVPVDSQEAQAVPHGALISIMSYNGHRLGSLTRGSVVTVPVCADLGAG